MLGYLVLWVSTLMCTLVTLDTGLGSTLINEKLEKELLLSDRNPMQTFHSLYESLFVFLALDFKCTTIFVL